MSNFFPIKNSSTGEISTLNLKTGEISTQLLDNALFYKETHLFDIPLAISVLLAVREGASIKDAANQAGLKTSDVHAWRRMYPAFSERLEQALEDRAFLYEDKMLSLANSISDDRQDLSKDELKEIREDMIRVTKSFDLFNRMAEIGNKQRYGDNKIPLAKTAINITIQTGVPQATPLTIEASDGKEMDEDGDEEDPGVG